MEEVFMLRFPLELPLDEPTIHTPWNRRHASIVIQKGNFCSIGKAWRLDHPPINANNVYPMFDIELEGEFRVVGKYHFLRS